jgi:hypothetical protein
MFLSPGPLLTIARTVYDQFLFPAWLYHINQASAYWTSRCCSSQSTHSWSLHTTALSYPLRS